MILAAQPSYAETGKWKVDADTSPLTDLAVVTATLASEKPLTNMVDAAQEAALVLRCRDRVLAAYVDWPEVLKQDSDGPQTPVFWRIDNGGIVKSTWVVSDDGTGAGAFGTAPAARLIASWRGAHRLVVRLSGHMIQDAVFDITGIDEAADKVLAACSASLSAGPTAAPAFNPGMSVATTFAPAITLASARHLLETQGFTVAADEKTSSLTSAPMEMHLTTKQADCGKALGIPYLVDHRAHPTVSYRVTAADGHVTVSTAIGGIYKGAVGAPGKPLRCASTGTLEADLATRIASLAR